MSDVFYTADVFIQTYGNVVAPPFFQQLNNYGRIAAATNSIVYNVGQIMAKWGAGGAVPGAYVNYTAGGSDDQEIPVAILVDDSFNISTDLTTDPTANGRLIKLSMGGVFNYAGLLGTVGGDVDAAITALGARTETLFNGTQIVIWPT